MPVNSIVEVSEPHQYKFKCVEGDLIGNDVITCNQVNGKWSPIPVCGSSKPTATTAVVFIIVPVLIIGLVAMIGFVCFKWFVLLRLLIIPIKDKHHQH